VLCVVRGWLTDTVTHIAGPMNHVVTRAKQLSRLHAAREYLAALNRVICVSEEAKAGIEARGHGRNPVGCV